MNIKLSDKYYSNTLYILIGLHSKIDFIKKVKESNIFIYINYDMGHEDLPTKIRVRFVPENNFLDYEHSSKRNFKRLKFQPLKTILSECIFRMLNVTYIFLNKLSCFQTSHQVGRQAAIGRHDAGRRRGKAAHHDQP